jgi:hypothetical protein
VRLWLRIRFRSNFVLLFVRLCKTFVLCVVVFSSAFYATWVVVANASARVNILAYKA